MEHDEYLRVFDSLCEYDVVVVQVKNSPILTHNRHIKAKHKLKVTDITSRPGIKNEGIWHVNAESILGIPMTIDRSREMKSSKFSKTKGRIYNIKNLGSDEELAKFHATRCLFDKYPN